MDRMFLSLTLWPEAVNAMLCFRNVKPYFANAALNTSLKNGVQGTCGQNCRGSDKKRRKVHYCGRRRRNSERNFLRHMSKPEC